MSDQMCRDCQRLLEHDDEVIAEIITRYVGLKSRLHYALERPTDCTAIRHRNCQWPKGLPEGD